VNGRMIDTPTLMANLDVIWEKSDIVRSIINLAIIEQAIIKRGLRVDPQELQAAMDTFRRNHRLFRREQLVAYLNERGISQARLEENLERQCQEGKLREAVTHGRLESYFYLHRADFETARVARFRVATAAEATRITAELESGRTSFLEVARAQFLANGSSSATFATLRRKSMTPEQQAAIFGAIAGQVVVTPSGSGFDVVDVMRIETPVLDAETSVKVQQAIFDEWLDEERRNAQITWYWGDPVQLPGQKNGWAG